MDYLTRPAGRNDMRMIANIFRFLMELKPNEVIEPELLLDKMTVVFDDVSYEIVENWELSNDVPAVTEIHSGGGYMIKIKEEVFTGAIYRRIGGYRMHIVHEIAHVMLDKLGYKPIFTRSIHKADKAIYSLEWKAKALAGEIMMPYEATKNMSIAELVDCYGVSVAAAKIRLKY